MSAVPESNNQVNFNPAWMQSLRPDKPNIRSSVDSDDSAKMDSGPIFAVHRYGREDILALIPDSTKPPDGLKESQFFVEIAQSPIILTTLNDVETRCQQNVNSSKALSLLTHQNRAAVNNGNPPQPTSPWTMAGGPKAKPATNSRWSSLTTGDSPNTGYIKAGTGRGGATGGLGRGGGIAGSGRVVLRNTPESKNGFNAGTRSRFKSTSEDDTVGNGATNNGWTVVGNKASHEPAEPAWRSNRGDAEQPVSIDRFDASDLNSSNGTFSRSNSHRPTGSPAVGVGTMSPSVRPSRIDTAPPNRYDEGSTKPIGNDWDPLGSKNLVEHHSPQPDYSGNDPFASRFSRQSSMMKSMVPESLGMEHDVGNIANMLDNAAISVPGALWCYLDPNGAQHGPYEIMQMLIWYKSGFFRNDLRCRKVNSENFVTLGELIQKNGTENPFVAPAPPQVNPIGYNVGASGNWHQNNADAQKILESQKALLEERRRLEEHQERLRIEEQERVEKERALRELELELGRRQAELHRLATIREQELEQKRREIAEYEQQQRAEAELHLAEKRRQEELEVLRKKEEVERSRLLLEEQQRQAEDKLRRQQEAAMAEAERLREQAIVEARKVAEEAERKAMVQQQQAYAEAQRQIAEQKRIAEEKRIQLAEAQRRREVEEAAAASAARAAAAAAQKAAAINAVKYAPWSATANTEKPKENLQNQRSLLEIQLEEERLLEVERKREAELIEQQRKTSGGGKPVKPWAGATGASTTKAPWSETSSRNSPVSKTPTTQANSAWPAMPASPVVTKKSDSKPVAKAAASVQQTKNKNVVHNDAPNAFHKWIVDAIKKLNKNVGTHVEAEPFSAFIETIQNPDEVEDYFLSYFGESDAVKEFHQEFLEKRIQLRPRSKVAKDDLSAAQSAVNATQVSSEFQTVKKKGKGKNKNGVKSVDLTVLSFKPSSDPNRFNAGEIDTAPPMLTKKKR